MNLDLFEPVPAPTVEFWKVAVPVGQLQALTYSVPAELLAHDRFRRGQGVIVPLAAQKTRGKKNANQRPRRSRLNSITKLRPF